MKKKTIALLGFSVLAGLALVGCGKNDDNNKTTTSAQGGDTTTSTTSQDGGNTTTSDGGSGTTTSQGGGNTTTSDGGSGTTTSYVKPDPVSYKQDSKGLDISVSYQGKQGISLIASSFANPIDGQTYTGGKTAYTTRSLLPTWKEFAAKVKTTIRDAEDYSANSDDNNYSAMANTNQWKSVSDSSQYVDLFYNSTKNIKTAISGGKAADLTQFINAGLMPNFEYYLNTHPTIAEQLKHSDGKIYYTPYFDGYQFLERQFVLNSTFVYDVLDQASFDLFDTTTAGQGASANQLQANKFNPFVYEMNGETKVNYAGATKEVEVSKNAQKATITVKGNVENIISQQNTLLAAGTTGKALAQQFKAYLTEVYGDNIGADKTFKYYSDIFCSESAAYTTDELVALMRVIKANPGVITGVYGSDGQLTAAGDTNKEIEIFMPRGADKSRIQNLMMATQLFGIQGTDSEDSNGLFFDSEGTLSNMRAAKSSYQALEYLHQFFEEGLIIDEFWKYDDSFKSGTYYRDNYFGHVKDKGKTGYGFIMYDYSATQGQANLQDSNGIGVKPADIAAGYEGTGATYDNGYSVGIMPVIPPLTYWATDGDAWDNLTADLTDRTNKTLMRYSDSNRSLKTNSWIIPATSDNKEKAAQLMDYIFSDEGGDIQDFGPSAYWGEDITYKGVVDRGLSAASLAMLAESAAGDCFSFWRGYIGASHGIGHVRSDHLNYIFMHEITRIGDKNLANALEAGVLKLATVDEEPAWGSCVPSLGYGATPSTDLSFDAVTAFWAQDKNKTTAEGWAKVVAEGIPTNKQESLGTGGTGKASYTYAQVEAQYQDTFITHYLYTVLNVSQPDLEQYIPEYVYNLV